MWHIEKKQELTGHTGAIYDFCIVQNQVFSAGSEGYIVKWNLENGMGEVFAKTTHPVFCLSIHTDFPYLFAGTQDGKVWQFDTVKKTLKQSIDLENGSIFSLLFSSSETLLIGTEKGKIFELDIENFKINNVFDFGNKSVRKLIVFGEDIFAAYSDFYIRKIDIQNTKLLAEWKAHENSVFALEIFDERLYSGGRDAMLKSWDLLENNPKLIQNIQAHTGHINDIKISPNKNLIATASMDKSIRIWDANSLELLKVIDNKFDGHTSSVNKINWLNENTLVSCSDDRKLMIWEVKEG